MPLGSLIRLAALVGPWQFGWHDDVTQPLLWLPLPGGGVGGVA